MLYIIFCGLTLRQLLVSIQRTKEASQVKLDHFFLSCVKIWTGKSPPASEQGKASTSSARTYPSSIVDHPFYLALCRRCLIIEQSMMDHYLSKHFPPSARQITPVYNTIRGGNTILLAAMCSAKNVEALEARAGCSCRFRKHQVSSQRDKTTTNKQRWGRREQPRTNVRPTGASSLGLIGACLLVCLHSSASPLKDRRLHFSTPPPLLLVASPSSHRQSMALCEHVGARLANLLVPLLRWLFLMWPYCSFRWRRAPSVVFVIRRGTDSEPLQCSHYLQSWSWVCGHECCVLFSVQGSPAR